MIAQTQEEGSSDSTISEPSFEGEVCWTTREFIEAHTQVVSSGVHNFQGCKIPIPTSIRYDRLRIALGKDITPKEHETLTLLKYGFPLNSKSGFGVSKVQKTEESQVCAGV